MQTTIREKILELRLLQREKETGSFRPPSGGKHRTRDGHKRGVRGCHAGDGSRSN
jgi:hypothetical protein